MTARAIAIISTLACALLCDSAGLAAESAVTEHALAAAVEQEVVATDLRIGGDDKQTRFVVDLIAKIDLAAFTLADPYRVVDRPAAGELQAAGQSRRPEPRPGQGVSLRADHAGRLAHRARHQGAGADRKGLRAGCRGRPAGPAGARPCGDRSRRFHAQHLAANATRRTMPARNQASRRSRQTAMRVR